MATVDRVKPAHATVKKPLKKASKRSSLADFTLATDVTRPSDNLQDYSFLLFGEKKIGKTKLASLFPESYFIKAEEGTKGVAVRGDRPDNWRHTRKIIKLLRKDKSRTVIVDTVDLLFKMCDAHVCDDLGVDHVSEAAWGKGWSAVRDEFTDAMNELMGMGKGVILISHATEREIKTRSGEKYDRIQPTMAGQARDICEAIVDIWAYFHYDGKERVLTIRGDEHISAGHRLDTRFRAPDGREIAHIRMTNNPERGYRNLLAAFNNQYKPLSGDVLEHDDEEDDVVPVKKVKKLVVKKKR